MNKQTLISIIVIVLAVIGSLVVLQKKDAEPRIYDTFASCLGEKGAKFFGAFWCPHCAEQKKLFGASVDKLPYVECSTPDASGQTQICIDSGIGSYPTWEFADGSRLESVQSLATLANKTGCDLPATENSYTIPAEEGLGESSEAITQ